MLSLLGGLSGGAARAAEAPLSFAFIETPPGELVSVGPLRLHLYCRGNEAGAATVVFESGLGGSAFEWWPIADALAPRTRACTYDRAGYAWSDPSPVPRHALRLAYELDLLLDTAALGGPFVLVAHSFGGLVARLLIERRDDIAALVLVDSSHEEQFARLERPGGRMMVPRGRQFVISRNEPPAGLPADLRRRVAAFGRMRKSYNATHGEMATFRESAGQVRDARARRGAPYDFPVTVLRRGLDLYGGRPDAAGKSVAWIGMQEDLATLGTPGRLVVAEGSGHHVHTEDPALLVVEIERLLERIGTAEHDGDVSGTSDGH